jgi:hypothetical protein
VKEECLSRIVPFREEALRRALNEFVAHYHEERSHQGRDDLLLWPSLEPPSSPGGDAIECKQRLGGVLKYYYREAA